MQSSSPLLARDTFSSIVKTLESVGLFVCPYHAFVPSFGVWGFALAKKDPFAIPSALPPHGLRFLDDRALAAAFVLPSDETPRADVAVNRLDNQAIVGYYEAEWSRWDAR